MATTRAYQIVVDDDQIYLISSDTDFLIAKAKLIQHYAQLTYPVNAPDNYSVTSCRSKSLLRFGFTHYLLLNLVLPKLITSVMTLSDQPRFPGINCHGAAIVASGACPVITRFNYPEWEQHPTVCEIPFDQLAIGDLVYYNSPHIGFHSFVFLDHDICLSANGWNKPLRIYTLQEILASYPLADSLILGENNSKVFRKRNGFFIGAKLANAIADFYQVHTTCSWYLSTNTNDYNLLANIAGSIYQELNAKPNKISMISELIWKKITDILPFSMVRRIEAEASTTSKIAQQLGINLTPVTLAQNNPPNSGMAFPPADIAQFDLVDALTLSKLPSCK